MRMVVGLEDRESFYSRQQQAMCFMRVDNEDKYQFRIK